MKTIYLVNHLWVGHHEMYIKLYCKALLSLKFRVVVISRNSKIIQKWVSSNVSKNRKNIYFSEFPTIRSVKYSIPIISSFINTILLWKDTQKAIIKTIKKTKQKPDLVFFLWLDNYLHVGVFGWIVDIIFKYPWSGLYFHPRHLRVKKKLSITSVFDPASALKSRNIKSVCVLDEGIKTKIKKTIGPKVIIVLPDIAVGLSSPSIDKKKIFSNNKPVVGLIGSLVKRKGVLNLIHIIKSHKLDDFNFILAGEITKETYSKKEQKYIDEFLKLIPNNCYIYPKMIPSEEIFNSLMKKCDLLYLVYQDFPHSSNSLTKASLFRIPVIVETGYCMSERVKKYGLGSTTDNQNTEKQIKTIKETIKMRIPNSRFDKYLKIHSYESLTESLKNMPI